MNFVYEECSMHIYTRAVLSCSSDQFVTGVSLFGGSRDTFLSPRPRHHQRAPSVTTSIEFELLKILIKIQLSQYAKVNMVPVDVLYGSVWSHLAQVRSFDFSFKIEKVCAVSILRESRERHRRLFVNKSRDEGEKEKTTFLGIRGYKISCFFLAGCLRIHS